MRDRETPAARSLRRYPRPTAGRACRPPRAQASWIPEPGADPTTSCRSRATQESHRRRARRIALATALLTQRNSNDVVSSEALDDRAAGLVGVRIARGE